MMARSTSELVEILSVVFRAGSIISEITSRTIVLQSFSDADLQADAMSALSVTMENLSPDVVKTSGLTQAISVRSTIISEC